MKDHLVAVVLVGVHEPVGVEVGAGVAESNPHLGVDERRSCVVDQGGGDAPPAMVFDDEYVERREAVGVQRRTRRVLFGLEAGRAPVEVDEAGFDDGFGAAMR